MKKTFNEFLTGENKIVVPNAKLEHLKVIGGVLHGAWVQDRPRAKVKCVRHAGGEMSFQLQAKCAHWDRLALKGVHCVLRQIGPDIVAIADWAAYTYSDRDYGYDLTSIHNSEFPNTDDEGKAPVATSACADGIGIAELQFSLREAKPILVDGSNIVRHFPDMRSKALAHLLDSLKHKGFIPTVMFDANVRYVLKEKGDSFGLELLERLLREDHEHTQIVPAETISDDYILLLADNLGCPVVTCDTFKQDRYRKQYPWLNNRVESGKKRVHAPAFVLGKLLIPTLDIAWQITDRGDVYIRACSNGKYLCADDVGQQTVRPILANKEWSSDWESFTILGNIDGTVSLKSKINGKFLSAEIDLDGRLNARADTIGSWERFSLRKRAQDGLSTLRSCANGKYVSVDPYTGLVAARAEVANEWEWLTIIPCN